MFSRNQLQYSTTVSIQSIKMSQIYHLMINIHMWGTNHLVSCCTVKLFNSFFNHLLAMHCIRKGFFSYLFMNKTQVQLKKTPSNRKLLQKHEKNSKKKNSCTFLMFCDLFLFFTSTVFYSFSIQFFFLIYPVFYSNCCAIAAFFYLLVFSPCRQCAHC